jgi:hypothetical protein
MMIFFLVAQFKICEVEDDLEKIFKIKSLRVEILQSENFVLFITPRSVAHSLCAAMNLN